MTVTRRRSAVLGARRLAAGAFFALALTGLLAAGGGCRGDRSAKRPRQFFPDMDQQARYEAQAKSDFFADGRTMRLPVAGTIAWGFSPRPDDPDRRWLNIENNAVATGVNPDGTYVQRIPVRDVLGIAADQPLTPQHVETLIRAGEKKYNTLCIVCHGGLGDGQGLVGQQWSYVLPSFHDPKYLPGGEKDQDGYVFHTIRNGVANTPGVMPPLKMPSYSDRVSTKEAWAVVAYFRALQRTRDGRLRDVPEALHAELLRTRGAIAPTQPTTPPAPQEPTP